MEDSGFEEPDGMEDQPARGLIHQFLLAIRILLGLLLLAWAAGHFASDKLVVTELLSLVHPLFWAAMLLLVPVAWLPRWLWIAVVVVILTLLGNGMFREQPNLFRLRMDDPGARASEAIRVSFWNIKSFSRGHQGIVSGFNEDDPDVVCMVEGTYRGIVHDSLKGGLGPSYQWASVRQMAIGSRFQILRSRELPTRTRLRVFEVRVLTPDGPVGILMPDFPRPPRLDTREMMQELRAILATSEPPYVVVGDLNTIRSSWRLHRATAGLKDFYTEAPNERWLATWRDPLHLWQIDHAFASPGVEPVFARFGGHGASYHLRLSIGFVLEESTRDSTDQAFAPGTVRESSASSPRERLP